MSLTKGNMRALVAMLKEACFAAGACAERFQVIYVNVERRTSFVKGLTALIQEFFGSLNQYHADEAVRQTYFEPDIWVKPLAEQITLLQAALPGAALDADYLATRQAEPVPEGYVRVVVPKLAFLQTLLRPTDLEPGQQWDVYEQIGTAIEHVCGELEGKHGAKFKNWRKGELTPNRVRCHEQAAERRQRAEATVPGDILILDVDLSNRTFGGKEKTCRTPRYIREEIGLSDNLMDLSSVDVGWILLLNEQRLTKDNDLCIDCTLEEHYWGDSGGVGSLCWFFSDGRLHFDGGSACYAGESYAAGVARLPGVAGT